MIKLSKYEVATLKEGLVAIKEMGYKLNQGIRDLSNANAKVFQKLFAGLMKNGINVDLVAEPSDNDMVWKVTDARHTFLIWMQNGQVIANIPA